MRDTGQKTEAVVLLHGFSGTHRAWDRVRALLEAQSYRPLALDLRGHGAAADRRPVSFAACAQDVLAVAPPRFALVGYSLGGRVALHVALADPARVDRLVLVSTSAGIEDLEQRRQRRLSDRALAERIERDGVVRFASEWARQPLFAGQAEDVAREAHADRLRNSAAGLAAALRNLGAGEMEPLWDRLGELALPVSVLAGERDQRYVALARRLAGALPSADLQVVPGAGHALHLERPDAVAQAVGRRS